MRKRRITQDDLIVRMWEAMSDGHWRDIRQIGRGIHSNERAQEAIGIFCDRGLLEGRLVPTRSRPRQEFRLVRPIQLQETPHANLP